MRTHGLGETIGRMKISRSKKKKRHRYRSAGVEIVGALSIASQMALLCPPGVDAWVRQELRGEGVGTGDDRSTHTRGHRPR
jgi:hypothetical protein